VRVTLVAVGKVKDRGAASLCDDYAERVGHFLPFAIAEVKDGRGLAPERAVAVEGERILAQLPDAAAVVLLDEQGARRTSVGFADWLTEQATAGRELRFVLGGAHGVAEGVKRRAEGALRLSDFTLPHELARVVFLEQLYRACTIQRGTKYHHA